MATKLKSSGKIILIVLTLGLILFGKLYWYDKRPQEAKASHDIGRVALPDAPEASLAGNAIALPLPSQEESVNGGTRIVWKIMAWNAQFPLLYANGGANTTKGSLADKSRLQIQIVRQDDCFKSITDIVKFAQDYKNNPDAPGVFASFMGDGMPAFFAALSKELEPLGPEYQPIAFYAMGKSYGEDQLMGPVEWKKDPASAVGKTVACVLRDGDMNILLKWAGDNNLKVNPDETTYDKNAINLIAANDFLDAANKYITGYKETRKLIQDGKKVSEEITVGVDAVSTWTPADVNVAQQKGGLVSIATTRQYSSQMPNITITIKKFAYDHRTDIENLIMMLGQAGDQVRSFTEAKVFAAKVSAKVYDEQTADYWLKYYNGITEKDRQGNMVSLGGSMAFNLQDAANMFGLGKDGIDRYKIVYTTFGDILSRMYPEYMATYPAYATVVDKSFLQSVLVNHPELLEGQALKQTYSAEITTEVSSRTYEIQFETGSAVIKSASYQVLDEILSSSVVAEGLKVGIYGHTDNTGSIAVNQELSEARAAAVKRYLVSKGLTEQRIESKGFGPAKPIADNATAAGRAKNRRVQIVLGE
ncbi:OmpA family protein [Parachryseolinea silvisoli]|uniref:OmpA family protein n=1 Tax=Parachryseolinea silvisoli TaxID=2873601 RepID=UPI0022657EE4|nr:OmpA family protein [Parachryseolinea silvisoli]MCD9018511.1 OmpA family protein [Parachryseolinea silvisoli]